MIASASSHAFVPRFILDQLRHGQEIGEFEAVGCFIDIAGFSSMTSQLMNHGQHGAEVLATIMRSVYDWLVEEIYAQGGFIAHFAGDALTAVFPGDSREQQAYQAVSAAWRIQQRLQNAAEIRTEYGSFPIALKGALAAGAVEWGVLRDEAHDQAAYYFRGPAVDNAAAVEKYAGAGETVVDFLVADALGARFGHEPAGPYHRLLEPRQPVRRPDPVDLPQPDAALTSRFLPEGVVDANYIGEFRFIVNVFIKLHGDISRAQLDQFMSHFFRLQRQYGGLLSRIDFGDKGSHLLLFWGAPRTYENDIQRALDFLLALQAASELPINAGVTYRIAHAGPIGSALREEFTCFGRGVNLAARLMSLGAVGEILVDGEIARRATAYGQANRGAHRFKGFPDLEPVFQITSQSDESSPVANALYTGGLYGRDVELAWLKEQITPLAQQRTAGFLLISGEAGLGKSRLIHEFISEQSTAQAFLCQTDEIIRDGLNPIRYWLRHYFGQSRQQDEAENKAAFAAKLAETIAAATPALQVELERTRSFLGALVGLFWPDSLYEQLEAEQRRENSRQALLALIQAEAGRQPTLLVIEDVHWLDDETAAFLSELARVLTLSQSAALPLAIVLTARTELAVELPPDLPIDQLFLRTLREDSLDAMLAEVFPGPVTPQLQLMLRERAAGNPYYAQQILGYLQAEGLLVNGDDGWHVQPDTLALPPDLRTLLVARLDRLDRPVREVIENAAILGREFDIPVMAAMLPDNTDILANIQKAKDAAIWTSLDSTRLVFQHALLRDASYNGQVKSRRQRRHAAAVSAFEQVYHDTLPQYYPMLAHHSEVGRMTDKASHYLELAGDQARDNYRNQEGIDFYNRLLRLLQENDHEGRLRTLKSLYQLQNLEGLSEPQRETLATIGALATDSSDPVQHAEFAFLRGELNYLDGRMKLPSSCSARLITRRTRQAIWRWRWMPCGRGVMLNVGWVRQTLPKNH